MILSRVSRSSWKPMLEDALLPSSARMIADETTQVETLGATQIKRAGENSVLAAIVIAVSAVVEKALGVMAEWSGASGKVVFDVDARLELVGRHFERQRTARVVREISSAHRRFRVTQPRKGAGRPSRSDR